MKGKRDINKAIRDKENGFHEWAYFTSQRVTEKVIKALALKMGVNLIVCINCGERYYDGKAMKKIENLRERD